MVEYIKIAVFFFDWGVYLRTHRHCVCINFSFVPYNGIDSCVGF